MCRYTTRDEQTAEAKTHRRFFKAVNVERKIPSLMLYSISNSWEKAEQAHGMSNVQQGFDTSDNECSQEEEGNIFETMDILSPSGHTDAQALALMLQEQLDAINNEIRY
ncbi:hypothetical protein AVEN_246313-1 [Araneus ventricosus]|uniref:Uncharacterized protein n=1 Tax=Araneus ventricosus TaxID=182803 RepID=A0A4Y2LA53_ARAVE|nr:hypothetical protein AVEN_246313-1 [Araneus ventricosus]